jgi:hypothetical protein
VVMAGVTILADDITVADATAIARDIFGALGLPLSLSTDDGVISRSPSQGRVRAERYTVNQVLGPPTVPHLCSPSPW